MPHEIKAWSYQPRTSRKERVCRNCGGGIGIGDPYLTITVSDTETAGSEKLSHQDEHYDCRMPWYLPVDISPTRTLTRVRKPKRWDENLPVTRYEIFSQNGDEAGSIHWHAPEIINRALDRLSTHARTKAAIEIERMFGTLARSIVDALGNPEKMRKLGIKMAEMQSALNREPDLSRFEKDEEG